MEVPQIIAGLKFTVRNYVVMDTKKSIEVRTDGAYRSEDRCKGSSVQPQTDCLIREVKHAVLIAHRCKLPSKHDDMSCECACGYRWVKNFK
mgnify:CR=1 FL=1